MSDQCFSSEDGKVAQVEASLQREVFWAVIFELVGLRVQEDVSFLNFLLKRKMSLLIEISRGREHTYLRGMVLGFCVLTVKRCCCI